MERIKAQDLQELRRHVEVIFQSKVARAHAMEGVVDALEELVFEQLDGLQTAEQAKNALEDAGIWQRLPKELQEKYGLNTLFQAFCEGYRHRGNEILGDSTSC